MKIEQFFAKRVTVADGLKVRVNPHFFYSTFGVRGRYDTVTKTGLYVPSPHPGTGFFSHPSDSSSYRYFVRAQRQLIKQNFWTLLFKKEPSFAKEEKAVEMALSEAKGLKRNMLSQYHGALLIAKEAEMVDRYTSAIKERIHKKHSSKYLVSILSHYKSRYATLQHNIKLAQGNILDVLSDEQRDLWAQTVNGFDKLVEARRVWHVVNHDGTESYCQVFFDLGIFNFVQSPYDTPVMRDSEGIHYYIYPTAVVRARSNVDFDIFNLDEVDFEFSVIDLNTLDVQPTFGGSREKKKKRKHSKHQHRYDHADAASALFATASHERVVGRIGIPQLDLVFFVNRTGPAEEFVTAINRFKESGPIKRHVSDML